MTPQGSRIVLTLALVALATIAAAAPRPATTVVDSLSDHALQAAADSLRAARLRQGWYPPADPESAAVRIGRRDAPLVGLPFTRGRRSLNALGRAVVSNLSNNGVAMGTLTFSGVNGLFGTNYADTMVGGVNDDFEFFRGSAGE